MSAIGTLVAAPGEKNGTMVASIDVSTLAPLPGQSVLFPQKWMMRTGKFVHSSFVLLLGSQADRVPYIQVAVEGEVDT